MKVIHILHELKFSGAEIMYVDAADSFIEKGCELAVVATATNLGEYAPYFEKASYKIFHLPYPQIKNYFSRIIYFKNFIGLLKENQIDIVHIHSHGAMWGFSLCAYLAGIKSVYTFHNVFPSGTFTFLYHVLLRWTSKNFFKCKFQTISDSVYNNELKKYYNKTTKIYNWFGTKRYYPALEGEKLKLRSALGIDKNTFVLISVGGCSDVKRHDEIINALQILHAQIPNCIYLHLGSGVTEQEEVKMTNEKGLTQKVRFLGNQVDIRKYLIVSDVYLMTSKFEGMPITTIEAMACEIPVLLYDVPGLRDFNSRGKICSIISPNFNELAVEISKLYKSRTESEALAKKAAIMMNTLYNLNTNSSAIFDLYNGRS